MVERIVPQLIDATEMLQTDDEFIDFAKIFLQDMAKICLPNYQVLLNEITAPQDEDEAK